MKVFVTVGSGHFDQLIEQVDKLLLAPQFEVCCQIGIGEYKPHQSYFVFDDSYQHYVELADVVVTHAGAGSVFELLEKGKKILVVPNQYRIDQHQRDLAKYIAQHNYAQVCWQLEQLKALVISTFDADFMPYQKDPFFKGDDLRRYFGLAIADQ